MITMTKKLTDAKKYLRKRGIWRGDPNCGHQYEPHNPDHMKDNEVTVNVSRGFNPTARVVTRT